MTKTQAIHAAHQRYKQAEGTADEKAAYAAMLAVVRSEGREEIEAVLAPYFDEDSLAWMVPSCPSVEDAKRVVADRVKQSGDPK